MKRSFGSVEIHTRLLWGGSQAHYQFGHGACDILDCEIGDIVFADFLKKYVPQKHLVQVNLREKLNFHDFYFQLRGAGY